MIVTIVRSIVAICTPQPVKRYEKVPTTFGNTQAQTRIAPVTTATHPVVKYVTSMSRSRHKQLESTAATYLRFATWASNFSVSRQATRDGFLRKLDRTAHLGYYLATRQCRPDRSEIALSGLHCMLPQHRDLVSKLHRISQRRMEEDATHSNGDFEPSDDRVV